MSETPRQPPALERPRWLSDAETDLSARAQRATTPDERARLWLNVSELRALLGDRTGARQAAEIAHEEARTTFSGVQAGSLARVDGDIQRAAQLSTELCRNAATENAYAHFAAWATELDPSADWVPDTPPHGPPRDIRLALRRSVQELSARRTPLPTGHPSLDDALASLTWLNDGGDALAELVADLRGGLDGDAAATQERLDRLAEHDGFEVSASWLAMTLAMRDDIGTGAPEEPGAIKEPRAGRTRALREVLDRAQARRDGDDSAHAASLATAASLALRVPIPTQATSVGPGAFALGLLSGSEPAATPESAAIDPGASPLERALELVRIAGGPALGADSSRRSTEAWLLRCASALPAATQPTDAPDPLRTAADVIDTASPETAAAIRLEAAIRSGDRPDLIRALAPDPVSPSRPTPDSESFTDRGRATHRLALGLARELAGDAARAADDYAAAADGGLWTVRALTAAREGGVATRWLAAAEAATGPMERALRLFDAARALSAEDTAHRHRLCLEAALLAPDLSPAIELADVLAPQSVRRAVAVGNEETVARVREALRRAKLDPHAAAELAAHAASTAEKPDDEPIAQLAKLLDPTANAADVLADVREQLRAFVTGSGSGSRSGSGSTSIDAEESLITEPAGDGSDLRAAEERALEGDPAALATLRARLPSVTEASIAWALAALLYFELDQNSATEAREETLDLIAGALEWHPIEQAPAWALRALSNREGDSTASVQANAELGRRCQRPLDAAALLGKAGSMAARLGDAALAQALLRAALKQAPYWVTFLDLYARLASDSDRPSHAAMAAETLAGAVSVKEHECAALIAAARYWTVAGRQDRAVTALEKALKVDPSQAGLFEELCELYEAAGAHRELAALIHRRLALMPADAPTHTLHLALGRALLRAGDRAHAKRAVAGLLKEQPDNVDALEVLAEACMQDNDLRRAEAIWSRLTELTPAGHRESALLGLSELARKAGDPARAMITLRQLLDEQPDCAEAAKRLSALSEGDPLSATPGAPESADAQNQGLANSVDFDE